MTYYSKKEYKFIKFEKSSKRGKMYNGVIQNKKTKKIVRIPFGSSLHQNFHDKTGLNAFPHLIHGETKRRRLFRARHKGFLRDGYYSGSYFSYNFLW